MRVNQTYGPIMNIVSSNNMHGVTRNSNHQRLAVNR
jgi:hypothetical protein